MLDTLSEDDAEIRALIRKSQAQASVSQDDVASGAFRVSKSYTADWNLDDDGDAGSGSGSGSDED